jgi:HAD superfamily hydrolase (TIGR01450 family)
MESAQGILVDLDGTLVGGGRLLEGAAAFLRAASGRCVVVSNDAEHVPEEIARKLRRLGAAVPEERILLAGTLGLERVAARRPGARILIMASTSLRRYARRLELLPCLDGIEVVFLGRDRRFGYDALGLAVNAVRRGAELVITNPDLTHPDPDGGVVPETGALLQALLACTGQVPYEVVGKPEPHLFEAALARLGLPPHRTVMIGDNPETDGLGAERLGIPFLRVSKNRPIAPELLSAESLPLEEVLA